LAVLSGISLLVTDELTVRRLHPFIPYWNALMGLGLFAIVAILTAALKKEKSQLEERTVQLQVMLKELDETRRQQLRTKDEFLSHVSHELRTPLAVVHQFSTIVADDLAGPTTPEQQRYFGIILDNVHQLESMIDDLLEAMRTQTGKLTIEPEAVEVDTLIADVLQSFQRSAAAHNLTFNTAVGPGLPSICADPRRVRQILNNLLDNAFKFTPPPGKVTIRAASENDFVRISVTDTGIGIAPEHQPKVFDRLHQVPGSVTGSRKGFGLGLHICRELVVLQGGRIWVESQTGKGTTIHFTLPVYHQEVQDGTTKT